MNITPYFLTLIFKNNIFYKFAANLLYDFIQKNGY